MLRLESVLSAIYGGGRVIKKRPFKIVDILDEPIFFESETKDKLSLVKVEDGSLFMFRELYKYYEAYKDLKGDYEKLREEHEALEEEYSKFKRHMGKGRAKGTYKLNNSQIQEVLKLYRDGISKRQIAREFKVDEKTVRNIIKRCS